MKSIDEGNGSLLDSFTVLYSSSMKDGNGQKKENLPILLEGRGGGSSNPSDTSSAKNMLLANLQLTFQQKYGLEKGSFNNVKTGTIGELI